MSKNLILWEVFIQSKVNLPYKHVVIFMPPTQKWLYKMPETYILEEMRVQVFGLLNLKT